MLFDSYKKRSIARQTGTVDFIYDVSLSNTTGRCLFGLSGSQSVSFLANSGKLYDPIGNFVSSYAANQSFSVSGQVRGGALDYNINQERVGFGLAIPEGIYDWMFVSPAACSADFAGNVFGEIPNYSVVETGTYTPNSLISGAIVNNNPSRPFRIFNARTQSDSVFSVAGFPTGNITGTGYITLQRNQTGLSDDIVPLTVDTNFGTVAVNFFVSGDAVEPPNFYISLSPDFTAFSAGSSSSMDVDFSYYPTGMQLGISLDYLSGTTGNIYRPQAVSMVASGVVSGRIQYGKVGQYVTGLISGIDGFGNEWTTIGSGVIFDLEERHFEGLYDGPYSIRVGGQGKAMINGLLQSVNVYAIATGLFQDIPYNTRNDIYLYRYLDYLTWPPSSFIDPDFEDPQFAPPRDLPGIFTSMVSGIRASSASIWVGEMHDGDYLQIGDTTTIYRDYDAQPPFSFNSLESLISIINNNNLFYARATQDMNVGVSGVSGLVRLSGTLEGKEGNIDLFAQGGITISGGVNQMTGGRTITYRATDVEFPLLSQRQLFQYEVPTHYVLATGEGLLNGTANVVHRIKSFTGTWSLRTGEVDYLSNGYVSGISGYHQPNPPTFMNKSNSVNMDIIYDEDYLDGNVDLALLTITGYGTNSGIQRILSGTN